MEKLLSEMFEDGMFSNIFYADENPAIINIEKTIKEDGKLKTITESNTYNLTSSTYKFVISIKSCTNSSFVLLFRFSFNCSIVVIIFYQFSCFMSLTIEVFFYNVKPIF